MLFIQISPYRPKVKPEYASGFVEQTREETTEDPFGPLKDNEEAFARRRHRKSRWDQFLSLRVKKDPDADEVYFIEIEQNIWKLCVLSYYQ